VPSVWEPELNPPVIARNADEEATLIAKGYYAAGAPDSVAFDAAQASPAVPPAEFIEFPKWCSSPDGAQVLAKTAAEEAALLAQWKNGTKKRAGAAAA
jgi:hypothetical protein